MAMSGRTYTRGVFAKFEMPGGDVRLSGGAALKYDSEIYAPKHSVWGGIAQMSAVESAIDDLVPGGAIMMAPHPDTPLSVLLDDAVSGVRVRGWQGEIDPETGEVATARLLADLVIDTPYRVRLKGQRLIALEMMSRAERLFLTNRGFVCSPRSHKSIWPGEKGFDNCTDIEVSVPWGTQAAPSGTAAGSGTGGGGGGGGRTWLDKLR